jgi:hypothetical protein
LKAAEWCALKVASQHNKRTNDRRMLRHKRTNECFFMDAFFATKKACKLSQGHNCCQLFVTDKGFVHVIPMKSEAKAVQAVKHFAKEIGAPEAMTCDMAGKQMPQVLKTFCQEIGAHQEFSRKEPCGHTRPKCALD